MLKLAVIIAGITFTIFCTVMTLRSRGNNATSTRTGNLFSAGGNKDGNLINDIKEIFGLPPLPNGGLSSLLSGKGSSSSGSGPGGYSSSGGGGYSSGAYLPPNSFKSDSEINPAAGSQNDSQSDLTTPLFRIFIASTKPPTLVNVSTSTTATPTPSTKSTSTTTTKSTSTTTTTPSISSEESLSEMEVTTTLPHDQSNDDILSIRLNPEADIMNFDLLGRGEAPTNAPSNGTSPSSKTTSTTTPKPKVQPKAPVTTLQPPLLESDTLTPAAVNLTENIIIDDSSQEETSSTNPNGINGSSPSSPNAKASGRGGSGDDATSPPTTLYLPPNKEYLPPKP